MKKNIYVREGLILSIEKEGPKYVLKMDQNGVVEKVFESENENTVVKLMMDLANSKKQEEEVYIPKNNISKLLKTNSTEDTAKNASTRANMEKFDKLKERINDKKLLANIPDDIKKLMDNLNIDKSSVLTALEQSKKNNVNFYEYLRLTLEATEDMMGADKLKKLLKSEGPKSIAQRNVKSKEEFIPHDVISQSEVHYSVSKHNNEFSSYLVIKQDNEVWLLEEVVDLSKDKDEEMIKFKLIETKPFAMENFENVLNEMKDKADTLSKLVETNNEKPKKENNKKSAIGSIDDYFNKNMQNLLDDYLNAPVPELPKNDKKKMLSDISNKSKDELSKYKDSIYFYIGKDKLPIAIYTNESIDIKDTRKMRSTGSSSEELELSDGSLVKIGYDSYLNNGEEYYVVYIQNEDNVKQEVYGSEDLEKVGSLIDSLIEVIQML